VGSTSTTPVRLGDCERWLVGLGLAGETDMGYWDSGGQTRDSSLSEQALMTEVGAAWRWSPKGQVALSLPARLSHKETPDLVDQGGGVGDLRAAVVLSPYEEGALELRGYRLPRLYASVGARLPTGTSWEQSTSALLADVTGLPGVGLTGGLSIERALGRVPWSVGVDGALPVTGTSPPILTTSASAGWYIGTRWTAVGSLRYSWTPADRDGLRTTSTRTTAGLRLIRGERAAWRAWLGADLDLPLSGLGRSNPMTATIGAGMVVVR
jgi:hypothetical protein